MFEFLKNSKYEVPEINLNKSLLQWEKKSFYF
jgi:hypothetical protein